MLEVVGRCVKAFRSYICASSITKSDRVMVLARPNQKCIRDPKDSNLSGFRQRISSASP